MRAQNDRVPIVLLPTRLCTPPATYPPQYCGRPVTCDVRLSPGVDHRQAIVCAAFEDTAGTHHTQRNLDYVFSVGGVVGQLASPRLPYMIGKLRNSPAAGDSVHTMGSSCAYFYEE